jgi:hypothetical protein
MRNTASFLGSFLVFCVLGCASSPPPEAASAEPEAAGEPAPPAPPPPAEPAPAAAPAEPAPAAAPAAEEKAPPPGSAKPRPTTAGYTGPDPCKLAVKGSSPVALACKDGGVKAAKAEMKDLVKRAKDNGVKFRCDDCHKDPQDNTKLAADAHDKFKKLLAAAK